MESKRKLKSLSLKQKLEILEKIKSGIKKKNIAEEYEIPASTLSTIIKNQSSILKFAQDTKNPAIVKRNKPRGHVNTAVFKWMTSARKQNLPVSGPILKQKALQFAGSLGEENFKASTGWLEKFKKRSLLWDERIIQSNDSNFYRYEIGQKTVCGEAAAVNEIQSENWIKNCLPELLAPYKEDDIFNADETGLFYKCIPNKTLTFKAGKCHGGKLTKERASCLLATNMTGTEKLKILLIGKSAKPRCFKGVKWLPVNYKNNKKAWMTGEIFENWLLELDKKFSNEGRKVLFFVDNCPAHPRIQHKLKAIKLEFFPPNMTSKLQPLDQGIINSFKCHYKRRILSKLLDSYEEKNEVPKIDLLDCVKVAAAVWNSDVSQKTIQNCFGKAGFGHYSFYDDEDNIPLSELRKRLISEDLVESEETDPVIELQQIFTQWSTVNPAQPDLRFEDFLNMDKELITSEHPTDKDIIESVVSSFQVTPSRENSDDSDVEEIEIQKPSRIQVKNAFETLKRHFTMAENTSDEIYSSLINVEKFYERNCLKSSLVRQNLITDYFIL